MKKKGDVNWFMVTLIIAAVAVIVVIMMLRQQSTKGVQSFENIRGETGTDALNKCSALLGRYCASSCRTSDRDLGQNWLPCTSTEKCCERA